MSVQRQSVPCSSATAAAYSVHGTPVTLTCLYLEQCPSKSDWWEKLGNGVLMAWVAVEACEVLRQMLKEHMAEG